MRSPMCGSKAGENARPIVQWRTQRTMLRRVAASMPVFTHKCEGIVLKLPSNVTQASEISPEHENTDGERVPGHDKERTVGQPDFLPCLFAAAPASLRARLQCVFPCDGTRSAVTRKRQPVIERKPPRPAQRKRGKSSKIKKDLIAGRPKLGPALANCSVNLSPTRFRGLCKR
jgi:hypothetical protein